MADESKVNLNISLVIVGDNESTVKDLVGTFIDEPGPVNTGTYTN